MTKKFLMLLLMLALAAPASAVQKGRYSIDILVNGRPLEEYAARGTTYIEALEGREYSIRLRNHTGRRIAVALAVDARVGGRGRGGGSGGGRGGHCQASRRAIRLSISASVSSKFGIPRIRPFRRRRPT